MQNKAGKHGEPSIKKEFLLFVSIPVIVIVIAAVAIQGPMLLAKPKYNFVYSSCGSNYADCEGSYSIDNQGKVSFQSGSDDGYTPDSEAVLYYYNVANNSYRPISIQQANSYRIDPSNVSLDGYVLWQNTADGGGFLFWDDSAAGNWYLKDGAKKRQLTISTDAYSSDVQFLGWVQ